MMARPSAGLPAGIRVSDHISLGVIAKTFPLDQVRRVLADTGRASARERDLPAHVMVYYVIALALYMSGRHPRDPALPVGGPPLALGR
jgi:Insertion element 4 transposase N-terminal